MGDSSIYISDSAALGKLTDSANFILENHKVNHKKNICKFITRLRHKISGYGVHLCCKLGKVLTQDTHTQK